MNELAERLYKIAQKKGLPEFTKYESRICSELQQMEELDILNDVQNLYEKVEGDPAFQGDINKPNSMLVYCLGITSKKPSGEFTNEKRRTYGRVGFPDIDMDFDYSRRHEIIEYLMDKYGAEHVGNIGTVQTLKTRAAVRRCVKVLDPERSIVFEEGKKPDQSANFQLQNEILNTLPDATQPMKKDDGNLVKNIQETYDLYPAFARKMDAYPEVFRAAKKVEGSISAYGCLAADTGVKTDKGQVRIDEIDSSVKVAYVDYEGKVKYTRNFYAHKTGIKKCYKMKLASGDWIKVTDEHLIFTDKGCVLFEKIRKNPEKYKVYVVLIWESMLYENVVTIEECDTEEVWDITMTGNENFYDDEHNFIAQNILVHNCHPAGIVISPTPLSQVCPLHVTHGSISDANEDVRKAANKAVATQFTMEEVEDLGLIKFDVLGLSTKTALSLAVKWIKQHHNVDIDLSSLPLDDKATIDLLNKGDTNGCFQAEKIGMQQTFRQIGIDSFNDVVVAVAMYRPGPKDYIPELSARKSGKHKIEYPHPLMQQITEHTYGIMAYQEQVMQVFMALADLTATDGYIFMKGCAKKKAKLIDEYEDKFIRGAIRNGVSEPAVRKVWADMKKFAGYAFCKSLHFSEKIITSEKDISIQELYNRRRRGEVLPDVYSPEGDSIKIVDVYDHGVIPTWEVKFSDGSKHKCTLDHKFMTNQGVYPLREIVKHDLFVIQNEGIKNAEKKGLDLSGVSEHPQKPKRFHNSQEGMRGAQTEQKGFCLSRLRPKIHHKRTSFSQKTVSEMEGNEVSTLLGIEQKDIEEVLGGDERQSQKIHAVQGEDVKSSFSSSFVQRKGNSSSILFNEETQYDSQNAVSEEQSRNSHQDLSSTRNNKREIRSTYEVEGGKSEGFFGEMRQTYGATEYLAFSCGKIFATHPGTVWVQVQPVNFQQKIQYTVTSSSDRFSQQRSKSNSGVRWRAAFQTRLEQRLKRTSAERCGIECRVIDKGISRNQNIVRHMAFGKREVQIQAVTSSIAHSGILSGKRSGQTDWQEVRITSIRYVGLKQCYDLKVDSEDHLYCLSSGIMTSNSHATSYAYECWRTAYLKAHFPVEFMAARMSVEAIRRDFDLVHKYEVDCKSHGISILKPDLNKSQLYYAKVGETTLLKPIILKGVGDKAAEEIIKHQPYKGSDLVYAIASKVGKVVNSRVIEALCDAKLFGDRKKSEVMNAFEVIKKDRLISKGKQVGDIFG